MDFNERKQEAKETIRMLKEEGYTKTTVNALSWNDKVCVITNNFKITNGTICKINTTSKYLLIMSSGQFIRCYIDSIVRLYSIKYVKPSLPDLKFDSESD